MTTVSAAGNVIGQIGQVLKVKRTDISPLAEP